MVWGKTRLILKSTCLQSGDSFPASSQFEIHITHEVFNSLKSYNFPFFTRNDQSRSIRSPALGRILRDHNYQRKVKAEHDSLTRISVISWYRSISGLFGSSESVLVTNPQATPATGRLIGTPWEKKQITCCVNLLDTTKIKTRANTWKRWKYEWF